jgi:hypothetical protein
VDLSVGGLASEKEKLELENLVRVSHPSIRRTKEILLCDMLAAKSTIVNRPAKAGSSSVYRMSYVAVVLIKSG